MPNFGKTRMIPQITQIVHDDSVHEQMWHSKYENKKVAYDPSSTTYIRASINIGGVRDTCLFDRIRSSYYSGVWIAYLSLKVMPWGWSLEAMVSAIPRLTSDRYASEFAAQNCVGKNSRNSKIYEKQVPSDIEMCKRKSNYAKGKFKTFRSRTQSLLNCSSLRVGSHLGAHARKAKSEFKRKRSGGEESGEEARIR